MAQGGAFAARASDPSAIFFNPAGVSWLRGTQVMGGAALILSSFKFRGPTNLNTNMETKMDDQLFYPINFYVTHSWDEGSLKGLGVGIGVNNPYGLRTKWDDNWIGRAITQETNLQTYYITPTVSYAINDMISIGAGFNYVLASVKLRQAVTTFEPPMNLELDGDGHGFGWNVGVLVKPIDRLSVGISYRSEAKVDFNGTADFKAPSPSLKALFPGGDVKTSVKLPATYFVGVAVKPLEYLELEIDYQGVQWSSFDKLAIDFVNDASNDPNKVIKQADVTYPKNYKNSYILRFGGEYNFADIGLKVRAGYLFDHTPVPSEHLEPLFPDADRHGINIGFGYKIMPNLTVDVSYLRLLWKQRSTNETSFDTRPTGGEDYGVYFDGTYNGNAHLFGLNLTYSF